jgi:hypothetical protein
MTIVWMSMVFAIVNAAAFTRYRGLGNSPGDIAIGGLLLAAFAAGAWELQAEIGSRSRKISQVTTMENVVA